MKRNPHEEMIRSRKAPFFRMSGRGSWYAHKRSCSRKAPAVWEPISKRRTRSLPNGDGAKRMSRSPASILSVRFPYAEDGEILETTERRAASSSRSSCVPESPIPSDAGTTRERVSTTTKPSRAPDYVFDASRSSSRTLNTTVGTASSTISTPYNERTISRDNSTNRTCWITLINRCFQLTYFRRRSHAHGARTRQIARSGSTGVGRHPRIPHRMRHLVADHL